MDATDISDGHADGKHGIEFTGVSRKELGELVKDVMGDPIRTKELRDYRKAYMGKGGSTVVIHDPLDGDGGTVVRVDPAGLEEYWSGLA